MQVCNKTLLELYYNEKKLEFLKIIEILKHETNEKNGGPYTTVRLTEFRRRLRTNQFLLYNN